MLQTYFEDTPHGRLGLGLAASRLFNPAESAGLHILSPLQRLRLWEFLSLPGRCHSANLQASYRVFTWRGKVAGGQSGNLRDRGELPF